MATGPIAGALSNAVWQVKVQFLIETEECQFGFKLRDLNGNAEPASAVLDELEPVIETEFRGLLTAADKLVGIDVQRMGTTTGAYRDLGSVAGSLSVSPENVEPAMLAAVVSTKGEQRTRYGQGRFFLPIRTEGYVTGNNLSATGITAVNVFLTAMENAFVDVIPVTDSFRLVNAHELLPAGRPSQSTTPLPEVPATWYDVDSMRLNTKLTSLRSRRPR